MTRLVDEIGRRYGRLTVRRRASSVTYSSGTPQAAWVCECDCGSETVALGSLLRNGSAKSCGCLRNELMTRGKRWSVRSERLVAEVRRLRAEGRHWREIGQRFGIAMSPRVHRWYLEVFGEE